MVLSVGLPVVISFVAILPFGVSYANNFHNLYQEYEAEHSAVGVLEEKRDAVQEELLELLDKYVDLDASLVDTVRERPEKLRTLFEQYPSLRVAPKARELMETNIGLVDDIAYQKRRVDSVARPFNSSLKTWPARHFAPDEYKDPLPYFFPRKR